MLLGLDFDNTLISYDRLFHRLALEKSLVPAETPVNKNAVRDYLRQQDKEDDWTRLQGEVYGSRILEAAPYPGMRQALEKLTARGVPMCIVSHKTRTPYLGEPWDLHAAARSWLAEQRFHAADGLGWPEDKVFFELTKEAKAQRVRALGCTHYVDDLPEILEMLPGTVRKILFAPDGVEAAGDWQVMRAWDELPSLIDVR